MEGIKAEASEVSEKEQVLNSLYSLSKQDWRNAHWPVISFIDKERLFYHKRRGDIPFQFWKDVLHPKNFLSPENADRYDPEEHRLFIIHTFPDRNGTSERIKTITTPTEFLIKDAVHNIDYNYHGRPCEVRGGGSYPTSEFWSDFYDNYQLSEEEQDSYPIPSKAWRKKFILEKYFREG